MTRKAATKRKGSRAQSLAKTIAKNRIVSSKVIQSEVPNRIAQPDDEPHVQEFLAMFSARGEFALMSVIRRTVKRELRKMLGGLGS